MLTFGKSKKRSWAGVLGVVLVLLNVMPVALAFADAHNGPRESAGLLMGAHAHGQTNGAQDDHHQLNDAQQCHESLCHFYVMPVYRSVSVIAGEQPMYTAPPGHWAVMPQAPPHRPPRAIA